METTDTKSRDFFWPSYVDLMTALFAVVLILFVLSFKLFKDKENEIIKEKNKYQVLAAQFERIKKIDDKIQALEKTGRFKYDEQYNRFLVKDFIGEEIFQANQDIIKPEFLKTANEAGKDIQQLIASFTKESNVNFLVLIEGNAAYGEGLDRDAKGSFVLSYKRALALYKYWNDSQIFDRSNTEIIVAGSGFYGVGRDKVEENNKRFIIQIIPKIDK
ncbi:MAG: hypothetical protein EOO46_17700 [Flavobacterium sp.]|nr:MAG: hypothetical protein EOO46_17700 [Flavobacterium sp.]